MFKRVVFLISLISLVGWSSVALCEIKVGVLAKRGPEVCKQRWSQLGEYLSKQVGEDVSFVPLKFSEVLKFCEFNPRHFLFANSWLYVRANVRHGAKAMVTVNNTATGTLFGGVILTRKLSGIRTLEQVRGKSIMCPKFSSAGGWIFQKGVLVGHGIRPEKDCDTLLEGRTHDAVVLAVKEGKVDVGTVRTNILERMSAANKIDLDDFVIINETPHEGFPEKCSTPLYPAWPIASLGETPPDLADRMKKALIDIPKNHPALKPCSVDEFVPALSYDPLVKLLQFLRVPPFRYAQRKLN